MNEFDCSKRHPLDNKDLFKKVNCFYLVNVALDLYQSPQSCLEQTLYHLTIQPVLLGSRYAKTFNTSIYTLNCIESISNEQLILVWASTFQVFISR